MNSTSVSWSNPLSLGTCTPSPILSWTVLVILVVLYVAGLLWIYKRGSRLCLPVSDAIFPYQQRLAKLERELSHLLVDDVHLEMTEQRLGHGSTGFVYKGFIYPRSSGRYKMKVPAAVKMSYPIASLSLRLLEEASRLAQLDHAHIVKLIGVSRSSFSHMRPAIALEWLAGGSLEDYFQNRVRGIEDERNRPLIYLRDVIAVLSQVASALRHMHCRTDSSSGREMVHGDVAARNVLMAGGSLKGVHVKLGDFGVPDSEGRRPVAWMPPEVLCANDGAARHTTESDIWMFGVFAWECLTLGATPHYQRSIEDIQRSFRLPDRGLTCPHSCPLDLWSVVLECLSEAHRRPRCSGRDDATSSLIGRLRAVEATHANSLHRVFPVANSSNCTCTEHRCKNVQPVM